MIMCSNTIRDSSPNPNLQALTSHPSPSLLTTNSKIYNMPHNSYKRLIFLASSRPRMRAVEWRGLRAIPRYAIYSLSLPHVHFA